LEKYGLNFDNDANLANATEQIINYLQRWIKN
jgi:hypothetical protein